MKYILIFIVFWSLNFSNIYSFDDRIADTNIIEQNNISIRSIIYNTDYINLLVTIILTIVVYRLSNKINFFNKIKHVEKIKSIVKELKTFKCPNCKKGLVGHEICPNCKKDVSLYSHPKIIIYNKRFFNFKYFKNNEKNIIFGYKYLGAELYNSCIEGVEFYCDGIEKDKNNNSYYVIGLISYDNIKYINIDGDDTNNCPIFYVKSNIFKFPYKSKRLKLIE